MFRSLIFFIHIVNSFSKDGPKYSSVIKPSNFSKTTKGPVRQYSSNQSITFEVYDEMFYSLFPGSQLPTNDLYPYVSKGFQFAHEGPVYLPKSDEVFFVSNRLKGISTMDATIFDGVNQTVRQYAIRLDGSASLREIKSDATMANGATIDCKTGKVILLSQGLGDNTENYSTFVPPSVGFLDAYTGDFEPIVNNFQGLPFNSPNGIVQSKDGTIWFTDPTYGSKQSFRGPNRLQSALWAMGPNDTYPYMVGPVGTSSWSQPNGVALSPDENFLYVTDTGYALGDGFSRNIYKFRINKTDLLHQTLNLGHIIYSASDGIPDGIKVDLNGIVFAGTGSGVDVITSSGKVLGKILCGTGGVTNLVFGGKDYKTLILLGNHHVWKISMKTAGALQCS